MRRKSREWFAEEAGFYGDGYIAEHSIVLSAEQTQREARFLARRMHLRRGSRVLDLACGYGRHTVALARRGLAMTGLDLNSFLLNAAKADAKRANVEVRWVKHDMRAIPFENEFHAVLSLFTSFGSLNTDAEHQEVVNQVAKALRRGGRFVLDVMNRDRAMRTYQTRVWREAGNGLTILSELRFDFVRGRNHEHRTRVWKTGKREEFDITVRMFTLPELIAMCERAGLCYEASYGDYTGKPVSLTSDRYILITRRP